MVAHELTEDLIREGALLVQALDRAGRSPVAALWLYTPDSGWKLLLAEPGLGSRGPRESYRNVQKTLQTMRHEISHLSLEDVSLAMPDTPLLKQLSKAVSTGPGLGGIRFTHNVVNGTMIDDAYIYRVKAAA